MTTENMIELIRELRVRTHLGMTECKKALEESEGDVEKAIEALQKKGLKKVDDLVLPTEGAVKAAIIKDHLTLSGYGVITEINCQTDFAARSAVFQKFVEEYLKDPNFTPRMLEPHLNMLSNQLGEKVIIRRSFCFEPGENCIITVYNHLGGKIAVLMESAVVPERHDDPKVLELLENIAMQIAANKPLAVNRESLPVEVVQKKRALFNEESNQNKGKDIPSSIKEKVVAGKMNKWYSEVVLLEQDAIFISETGPKGQTVQKEIDKRGLNGLVKINRFVRYERGEVL